MNPLLRQHDCPHPARKGVHEEYGRPAGSSFCRACGAELDPPKARAEDHWLGGFADLMIRSDVASQVVREALATENRTIRKSLECKE